MTPKLPVLEHRSASEKLILRLQQDVLSTAAMWRLRKGSPQLYRPFRASLWVPSKNYIDVFCVCLSPGMSFYYLCNCHFSFTP
nr:uncharacterized protein LOC100455334 isoform X1 [Pongo abelii]